MIYALTVAAIYLTAGAAITACLLGLAWLDRRNLRRQQRQQSAFDAHADQALAVAAPKPQPRPAPRNAFTPYVELIIQQGYTDHDRYQTDRILPGEQPC